MEYLGEFLGTAILVILGNGAVFNIIGGKTSANGKDYVNIAFGWGFAVLVAVLISMAIGAPAQLNPAVTIGFLASGELDAGKAFAFMGIQLAGAIVGQIILDSVFANQIKDMKAKALGGHSTGPSIPGSKVTPSLNEFFGTMVLVATVMAVFGPLMVGMDGMLGPVVGGLLVALTVSAIGFGLGGVTGWAINPARDLGPRIVYSVIHKTMKFEGSVIEAANWKYAAIPVVAPLAGGAIVGAFFRLA